MNKILIFGAGGFGREVQWLIERINQKKPSWEIVGYLDDGVEPGTEVNGYQVLGGIGKLKEYDSTISVVCAVGSANVRRKIVAKIKQMGQYQFPNLIDPDVKNFQFLELGEGNIICAGNILTVNITIQDFAIINLSCTIGHDVVIESFATIYPGTNISGYTHVESGVELGTGSKIIQGKTIGKNTIVGAGAVVVRDLPGDCTVIGTPAKPVKFFGEGYKRLLIMGASGHGKVMFSLARETGAYQEISFLDDDNKLVEDGVAIGTSDFAIKHKEKYDVAIAIGNPSIRQQIQEKYEKNGIKPVTLIHPGAVLPEQGIKSEAGTVVMAGAVIQPEVRLGKGVIVNTSASIDHECKIGDYAHISVGSHLAGNVEIGNGTWIGVGAVVSNNIHICENVMVGAGAVVVEDIVESGTYVGVPARKIA